MLVSSRTWRMIVISSLVALLSLGAFSAVHAAAPFLAASVNPVPFGTFATALTVDTGDPGIRGILSVVNNGVTGDNGQLGTPKTVAAGNGNFGPINVDYISSGSYVFTLRNAADNALLAQLTVSKATPNGTTNPSIVLAAESSPSSYTPVIYLPVSATTTFPITRDNGSPLHVLYDSGNNTPVNVSLQYEIGGPYNAPIIQTAQLASATYGDFVFPYTVDGHYTLVMQRPDGTTVSTYKFAVNNLGAQGVFFNVPPGTKVPAGTAITGVTDSFQGGPMQVCVAQIPATPGTVQMALNSYGAAGVIAPITPYQIGQPGGPSGQYYAFVVLRQATPNAPAAPCPTLTGSGSSATVQYSPGPTDLTDFNGNGAQAAVPFIFGTQ